MIVAGALLLADAGLTLVWQEPLSALYGRITQGRLGGVLKELERRAPSAVERRALARLPGSRRRLAFLARSLERRSRAGDPIARLEMPSIDARFVVVAGTDAGSLRKGPGHYRGTPLPGRRGTVAIAGHRTTYLAPFRDIDDLEQRDRLVVSLPYGRFTYSVEGTRVVAPSALSVLRRVGHDRLVLTACHPLFSAARRIVVFARLVEAAPRGAAVTSSSGRRAPPATPRSR